MLRTDGMDDCARRSGFPESSISSSIISTAVGLVDICDPIFLTTLSASITEGCTSVANVYYVPCEFH